MRKESRRGAGRRTVGRVCSTRKREVKKMGVFKVEDEEKALDLFVNMLKCQAQLAEVMYSSILRACASLAALESCIQIHLLTVKSNYNNSVVVGNSLIDVYAKCGSIKDAQLVSDMMSERGVFMERYDLWVFNVWCGCGGSEIF
ncbi:putative pentatricopeptide repeat-containing protein [Tripterygium wilfordii]|uniref:Putative pentatricopeptide repeat-containing protein n=1 Tax=Tripterygium wilfordii TaxID=458696 RepID=A0A7J7D4D2_TRIWF|nr:putative pentatricopeptide repeat-containing protein [Tripterygium wilfordii]